MGGLPIDSSVTGLLKAGERVTGLLSPEADAHGTSRDVLTAVRALQPIFRRLDGVITPPNQQTTAQKSRIQLCDLVIALTDCVNTFSDLEAKLKELGAGTNGVTLTAWERVGDGGVAAILRHLQVHEASLGLMLSIYSCKSTRQAQREIAELRELISDLLRSNPSFIQHRATYIPPATEEPIAPSSCSVSSVNTASSHSTKFSAKRILRSAAFGGVYRRAERNASASGSTDAIYSPWSQPAGLTLADISDISAICLPVYVPELSNADLYQQPKTAGLAPRKQLERVQQASGRIHAEVWHRLRVADGVKGVALLHEAAGKGFVEVVRAMLQNREVHENATDSSGVTAVHHSALNGHLPTLQLLFDQGANVDTATTDGRTALHCSAEWGGTHAVQMLLDRGAKIDYADTYGQTALHYAAEQGNTATVQLLLDNRAKINAADKYGETALLYAAERGHTATVQLLIARGANIDAVAIDGKTALRYSVEREDTATIQLLLDKGADTNIADGYLDWTVLHYSAERGHTATVQLLLYRAAKINIDAYDKYRKTALRYAVEMGHTATILLLLDMGANLNIADEFFGWTVLHYSAEWGQTATVRLLLDRGAKIDAVARDGKTALCYSEEKGHTDIAQLLRDRATNIASRGGRPALHYSRDKLPIVQLEK